MQFTESRWIGNGWAAIDIIPAAARYFLPLFSYLAANYEFDVPPITDRITGYAAAFEIMETHTTPDIDTYDFSFASENEISRDRILTDLHNLPPDFLKL